MSITETLRAHKVVLDPAAEQAQAFTKHAGAARWAYNHALAAKVTPHRVWQQLVAETTYTPDAPVDPDKALAWARKQVKVAVPSKPVIQRELNRVKGPYGTELADELRALGMHWDRERRVRWASSSKAGQVVELILADRARRAVSAAAAAERRDREVREAGERAAQAVRERSDELASLAQQRPIFRRLRGVWRLVGAGLSVGQRVDVETRSGEVRAVRVLSVSPMEGERGGCDSLVWPRCDGLIWPRVRLAGVLTV
ncbi:helix-turn-helix domain-containing protein [Arsenicicoccus sp. UBA7492]|uniref:helix-turn-helix domain-containing protein n=1 Tax=Arsenicicoccus sp. UBA7492 TaxID=1946057 RepID=UPI00257AAA4B|nr:helix-turn-helix domain-containing protein [Arsenicicoccus sp. UBA7492]